MISTKMALLAVGSLLLTTMTLLAPVSAGAQDEERSFSDIRTVRIKASKYQEFIELQTTFRDALQADGRPGRDVWQEVRGDVGVMHIVNPIDSLAELDEQWVPPMEEDAWAEWVEAINGTVNSSARMILRRHPEYSIPSDDDSAPAMLVLRYTTVAPGKGGAYHDWLENQLVPALTAGGASGVSFGHVALGGDTNLWVSASRVANWTEIDGPGPLAAMSEEERAALFAPYGDMVTKSEVRVLRYRTDLSYASADE